MDQENNQPITTEGTPVSPVPWSILDTWIAVGLLVVLNIGLLIVAKLIQWEDVLQSAGIILAEMLYLMPVVLIFAWRGVPWNRIGFGRFDAAIMGMGCSLLIGAYIFIILHNLLLLAFGVDTQGQAIVDLFAGFDTAVWFIFVGAIVAPLVEEIFFRGFLFQGFRQRYGWVPAMLISSAIFAAAHLDPVAFIPTFLLGAVLAYVYHRSNSVWPGVILHFLVNAFGLCAALAAVQLQNNLPV